MPGWSDTIKRITEGGNPRFALRKHLGKLSEVRGGRNVIVYSLGFMLSLFLPNNLSIMP